MSKHSWRLLLGLGLALTAVVLSYELGIRHTLDKCSARLVVTAGTGSTPDTANSSNSSTQQAALQQKLEPYRRLLTGLQHFYEVAVPMQEALVATAGSRGGVIGNIAWFPHQTQHYASVVARLPGTGNICEVGFGAGHSTALWLALCPNCTVYTFDHLAPLKEMPGLYKVQLAAMAIIERSFDTKHRWHRYPGNSNVTFHKFLYERGRNVVCDIVHVDGDHSSPSALWDIINFHRVSRSNSTWLLVDDVQSQPGDDYREALRRGLAREVQCVTERVTDPNFCEEPIYVKTFCESVML